MLRISICVPSFCPFLLTFILPVFPSTVCVLFPAIQARLKESASETCVFLWVRANSVSPDKYSCSHPSTRMNRPSRTDEPQPGDGYNQSPPHLSNDLTTNQDLNGISNTRALRRQERRKAVDSGEPDPPDTISPSGPSKTKDVAFFKVNASATSSAPEILHAGNTGQEPTGQNGLSAAPGEGGNPGGSPSFKSRLRGAKDTILTFGKFVGPGFMVAVAYSMPPPAPKQAQGEVD